MNYSENKPSEQMMKLAEEQAELILSEMKKENAENKRKQKKSLIKLTSMLILLAVLIAFSTIAWFTSSREVGGEDMQMTADDMPFEIKTRSSDGFYKSIYEDFQDDAAIWQVTADHNFNNDSAALEENESEPGLEPGDSGSLEFCIKPKEADSITLDCVFEIRAFTNVENSLTHEPELQEMSSSDSFVKSLSSHIMLFEEYDTTSGKYSGLIGDDDSLRRVLKNKSFNNTSTDEYLTIYWVWPEHLSDLTDKSKAIYKISDNAVGEEENENGYTAVIDYIAANKDGFFKNCTEAPTTVKNELLELGRTNLSQIYNKYNLKYDNADLDIGNNINYVIISMTADSPSE
ncbi:MAG: hypothetical protein J6I46_11405 [Ruminococcus sp.]|nr:hypothetical protein [Ruminococcus sp.]